MSLSKVLEKKYAEATQKTNEVYEKFCLKWGDEYPQNECRRILCSDTCGNGCTHFLAKSIKKKPILDGIGFVSLII